MSSNIQPTQSYSQAVLPLLQAPDVEIRLISKALLASLSVTAGGRSLALDDAEVSRVVQMLNTDLTEPFSFHGLSFEALFVMIKQLATIPQNTLLFVENAVPSILADLSERLLDDEKTASLELMWLLMQGEGAQDIVGATAANPSDITEPCSETKWSSIGMEVNHYRE